MRRLIAAAALAVLAATGCLANPTSTGPDYTPGPPAGFTDDPTRDPGDCTSTETGEVVVTTDDTVIDGLCLDGGSLVIDADNVTVQNSYVTAAPPTYFTAVAIADGATGVTIRHNEIDCASNVAADPNANSFGMGGGVGTSGLFARNEIRNCANGIVLQSNWTYEFNYLHAPYNCDNGPEDPGPDCDIHADGIEGSAEAGGGPGLHDIAIRWNTVEFPGASGSMQFHGNSDPVTGPGEGWSNVVVAYNAFRGGAYAVRLPAYDNGGLEFYGNRLANYPGYGEFGLCTPKEPTNNTSVIDVWGTETGDTTDSLGRGIPDDANIDEGTGAVFERADCE